MLTKRFNFATLVLTSAVCSALAIMVVSFRDKQYVQNEQAPQAITALSAPSCQTVTHRLDGYQFIKPLLYNDQTCESGNYDALKANIENAISQYKQAGNADNISVYLKLLTTRDYIGINENEMYHPASLIKLPILITYLKMEEKNPGILNKKLVFTLPKGGVPQQTYNTHQIEPGKSYPIKELLKYMVAYSDNNATYVLNNNVDLEIFKKMFSDFGLVVPDVHDMNYQISAKDYSIFLNIIYNAGYLSIPHCEFAAEILSECDFKAGIESSLPPNVQLAHKFGEWGVANNPNIHQLSESGIVYLDNSPYILTVMTQGKDVKRLPEVISEISSIIYNTLKGEKVLS